MSPIHAACCALLLLALALPEATAQPQAAEPAADATQAEPAPLTARRRDFRARRSQPMNEVSEHAAAILPYAALANAVYCDAVIGHQGPQDKPDPACAHDDDLRLFQWQLLFDYPRDGAALPLNGSWRGLRFSVYFRDEGEARPVTVGVAFRGTDFTSWTDWHSNLRWVLPGRDQYDVVAEATKSVIADSKAEIARRLGRAVTDWHIVATGHSLGGGLAQLFAYKSDEVRGAVVFDPSPVTGFHSCVSDDEVNCNVPIWRVYERKEVLAYLRAFTRLFYPLSENITELEFDLLGGNVVANHSMPRFYSQLRTEVQRRPVPLLRHAALFAPRPDCWCSEVRRPRLLAQVQDTCMRLATERGDPPRSRGGEIDAFADMPELGIVSSPPAPPVAPPTVTAAAR